MFDRETLDRLFQYCLALCHDRDGAYDLLHQSLEKFLRADRAHIDSPVAYVRRIARNSFYDQWRRDRKVEFEILPEADELGPIEKTLENSVINDQMLERVWNELSAVERETLYFWAVEGMSAREIALHLEQPRASVLSRLKRTRDRITERYPEAGSGGDHD